MKGPVDRDRRRPLPGNHLFEAHDWHDPTNWFLLCYLDEGVTGTTVSFCGDADANGQATVHASMWLDADQCEAFGNALLDAAKAIRTAT